MLLKGYRKEISNPTCNPQFQSVHCIARLDEDIGEALPYLNAALGGDTYIKQPPSVTFKAHGRLITVHARMIAINALRDEQEADHILEWLRREINDAWENRDRIGPRFIGNSKPRILKVYKLLPRTNCRACGQPTCMVFASLAVDGAKGADDCTALDKGGKEKLRDYLGKFTFL